MILKGFFFIVVYRLYFFFYYIAFVFKDVKKIALNSDVF
ncbi:hypothetical protein BTEBP_60043 [Brochothrix thermosphacta]|nr:hypothetical protein BTEBP_60043 [Brochothrix thermosphacta]